MNLKKIYGLFVLILLTTGCISEYNANQSSTVSKILIVSGNIIANSDLTFFISESFSLNSPDVPDESFVNNANLTIIGSNGYQSSAAINQGKGVYRMRVGELENDVEYGVEIQYNGDIYQSTLSKPLQTPEIDSVSMVQPEKYGAISVYVSTHDDITESKFFAWDYMEDWETVASIQTMIFLNPADNTFFTSPSATLYYCWKKDKSEGFVFNSSESLKENRIIDQQLFQCSSSNDRFSVLYSINVTQRAISKNAYEYYQIRKKMNEEMGGLFTPQPSELTGNITCITNPAKKVMGYVNVNKNTTQKRIFVYPYQITREGPIPCGYVSHSDVVAYIKARGITFADYYRTGMRPAGEANTIDYPEIIPIMWASSYCTECTANGGTKDKPDFWPNDHK